MKRMFFTIGGVLLFCSFLTANFAGNSNNGVKSAITIERRSEADSISSFEHSLSKAAILLTKSQVEYDPSYFTIPYPNGDVPAGKGVCTDVVIRAYRKMGFDLQRKVHEDMSTHFSLYPKIWGLKGPDSNIDHRRVPNLMVFFARFGKSKPLSLAANDYQEGDIVCWNLGGSITHIGLVVHEKSGDGKRPLIVHNIGGGQVLSDCLFDNKIIGHYSYR